MNHNPLVRAGPLTLLLLGAAAFALQAKEPILMKAHGTFTVKTAGQTRDNPEAEGAGIDRLSLSKRFEGTLDAASQGEMLAMGDGVESGAYVALEKITGTLEGRQGSFAMMHRSGMAKGTPQHWSIMVVPDSGTDELAGIEGTMTITIRDGKHFYDFDYSLPTAD